MKYRILHESEYRIRIGIPRCRLRVREADILEYYLKSLDGVKNVTVNESTGNASITFWGKDKAHKEKLFKALAEFDFGNEKYSISVPEDSGRELNKYYKEKIVMMVTGKMVRKFLLPQPLSVVRTLIKSVPFLCKGVKSLRSGKPEVPLLDAAAISASILRRDYATASSVMFLLNLGDALEEWTRKKAIGDLARAMSLEVDHVWVVTENGSEIQKKVTEVCVGDHMIVRDSNIIPLDGVVFSGEMTVNQSAMTGESEPVCKRKGSSVYAGTVVEEGECTIVVKKTAGSGRYDQIVHMIEESEKLKSDTEAKAYRLADSLVPYSLAGSVVTYFLTRSINKALSFLMVDYSCAMKLSMPLSMLTAIREARDYNIAVKGGKFLEAIADADTIVFDKTGTLTHASPTLEEVVAFGDNDPDEMLRLAACLEEHYPHSVANAVVKGAEERNLLHEEIHSKVQYVVAHGVSSSVNGEKVVIGSYHFVMEDEKCVVPEGEEWRLKEIDTAYSRLFLAIGGRLAAVLCILDPLREEAVEVIDALHDMGISKICMMTGDNKKTAKMLAGKIGLDEYYAEVLPEDKAAYIRKEHEAGRKVIMIGDGINDTPALAEADVGIAISDGAAIARQVADVTIMADNLRGLITLRKLSGELMKRIKGNYHFIIGFNSVLIGLGLLGMLPPATSALLHNGSTIITGVKSTTYLLAGNNPDKKA